VATATAGTTSGSRHELPVAEQLKGGQPTPSLIIKKTGTARSYPKRPDQRWPPNHHSIGIGPAFQTSSE